MNATGALTLVRERTKRYIPVVMGDVDALTIALTCATMERDSLLELSHDKIVSTEALRFADQLKMTCDEFNELFCSPTTATTKPLVGTRRGIASLQATTAALQLQDNLVETKELHDIYSKPHETWGGVVISGLSGRGGNHRTEREGVVIIGLSGGVGNQLRGGVKIYGTGVPNPNPNPSPNPNPTPSPSPNPNPTPNPSPNPSPNPNPNPSP